MAYDQEVINEAKNLYLQNYSFRKIAQTLKIKRMVTIQDWAKKFKWERKRVEIESKSDQIAEEALIEKLGKSKSKYKVENVEAFDANKSLCGHVLSKFYSIMQADKTGELLYNAKFMKAFNDTISTMNETLRGQNDTLFGKNQIDVTEGLRINADEVIKATIDWLDQSGKEENDLAIGYDLSKDIPKTTLLSE